MINRRAHPRAFVKVEDVAKPPLRLLRYSRAWYFPQAAATRRALEELRRLVEVATRRRLCCGQPSVAQLLTLTAASSLVGAD